MTVIAKPTVRFVSTFLLIFLLCVKVSAEPIEPYLTKEAAMELLARVKTSKHNADLVDDLLDIAQYHLSQNSRDSEIYIERALSLSEKLSYHSGLIKGLCLKATLLRNILNDISSANRVIDRAISLGRIYELPEMEAYAFYTKGEWDSIGDLELAIEYYTIARNLYRSSGNKIKEAFVVKCMANTHLYQNRLSQSLKELLEALEIYKGAGYPKLHYTYDLIGVVYRSMGNYQEALKYSLLAIKSAEKTSDTVDIDLFYLRVGTVFDELNQPFEAIQYFSKVLKKAENEGGNFYFQQASASRISKILMETGRPEEALEFFMNAIASNPVKKGSLQYCSNHRTLGDIYFSLKNYSKAEEHYLKMLETNEKNSFGDSFNLISFLKLGDFYIAQSKFAQAKEYINKALVHKSLKSKTDIANLNLQQFKVDSAYSNFPSAIRHYQTYKALNDSMFNERSNHQIASMNIQYETEKKLQEIETLTAKNKEQKIVLEKRVFERNVFTAGAIMLLLLLLLSGNRYQIKQRANKKLREQQETINNNVRALNCLLKEKEGLLRSKDKLIYEKEWLIKEVHHRVKNNLQMISTLLYSQAAYLKDSVAIAVVRDSQQRIYAISLLHQKLYQSDNLQLVNMKNYVHELVDYLKESFDTAREIEFYLEVDSFEMEIVKAIPLGLILNEAITNSLKYAFSENNKKIISVLLQRQEDQNIQLVIRDNGKGLPTGFDPHQSDSLGINLMQGLSNQIGADFSIMNKNGTTITLYFKESDKFLLEQVI
ncbi:tetratricopeptide repeat-containing sensor histidine kinase [Sinomicrobium sp. M5D2P17]